MWGHDEKAATEGCIHVAELRGRANAKKNHHETSLSAAKEGDEMCRAKESDKTQNAEKRWFPVDSIGAKCFLSETNECWRPSVLETNGRKFAQKGSRLKTTILRPFGVF